MKNSFCEMFGLDMPLLAFSHCRDVVVEISKAGGLGVLGAVGMLNTPQWPDLRGRVSRTILMRHQSIGSQQARFPRR